VPFFDLGITRDELQAVKNLTEENIQLKRLLKTKTKEVKEKSTEIEAVSNVRSVIGVRRISRVFALDSGATRSYL
jgi:hypothetical protein